MSSRVLALVAVALLSLTLNASSAPALRVVATLPDFASIAEAVGGDRVEVSALARGTEDAHFVDAKPSFLRVLNRADLLLQGGADLEVGWLPALVQNARNERILRGGIGEVDLSVGIPLLEVPETRVDRSQGDVHPYGNPHFWLDPANGKIMAEHIARVLSRLDPPGADGYRDRAGAFCARIDAKQSVWSQTMVPWRGTKILTYHKSYEYLARRFGLEIVGQLEPQPGIEPSPTHIHGLISRTQSLGVRLVVIEPFRPRRTAEKVAQAIGARVLVLPEKTGGHEKVKDYLGLFDYAVAQIDAALREASR